MWTRKPLSLLVSVDILAEPNQSWDEIYKPHVISGYFFIKHLNKGIAIMAFITQQSVGAFGRQGQQIPSLTNVAGLSIDQNKRNFQTSYLHQREKRLKTEFHLPNDCGKKTPLRATS